MVVYRLIYVLSVMIYPNPTNIVTTSLVNLFSVPVGLCDRSAIG